jgi:hypothetical protein
VAAEEKPLFVERAHIREGCKGWTFACFEVAADVEASSALRRTHVSQCGSGGTSARDSMAASANPSLPVGRHVY